MVTRTYTALCSSKAIQDSPDHGILSWLASHHSGFTAVSIREESTVRQGRRRGVEGTQSEKPDNTSASPGRLEASDRLILGDAAYSGRRRCTGN